jgi:hypothetical protein
MNCKSLLSLFAALFAMNALAQSKVFSFNEIQCRNNKQQWEKSQNIAERTVRISPEKIDVMLDKNYHLNVLTTTFLPDKGAIYLCCDEKQNKVTVMLINDDKMYLYNDTKRFLINFSHPIAMHSEKNAFADVD